MSDEHNYLDDEAYRIKDWTPPWIDNGERFSQLIEKMIELDDDDAWKVLSVLLCYQLDEDIRRLKSLHDQLKEIEKGMEL